DAVFQLRRAGFPGRDINQYLDLQRISAGDGHAAHPEYAGADELFMQGLSAPRTKAASAVCRAGPAWRRMAYCVVGMRNCTACHGHRGMKGLLMTSDSSNATPQSSHTAGRVEITLVAALDENGLIGAGGGMPWYLPADLRHFKRVTLYKPIVMGRRTFEAIGRPLPQRRNIVLTRDRSFVAAGCEIV